MRGKTIFFFLVIVGFLIGCASNLSYNRSSRSDIPFHKRKVPSLEKAVIIDSKGPALDSQYYEIMGKVESEVTHVSALSPHCKEAIKWLRYEAENVGGDALIDVSCASQSFGATATGTVISFKNRKEALKALKEINAVIVK